MGYSNCRGLWLAAWVIVVVMGAWLLAPPSQITKVNYDRIDSGMNEEDVVAIFGDGAKRITGPGKLINPNQVGDVLLSWGDGPNWVCIFLENERVIATQGGFGTPWEAVVCRAKTAAERIGVKWH
jgi:hypothetical protein